jgi:predicted GNAT superfamily acetyltransferase
VTGVLEGRTLLVAVPPDIASLRAADPGLGREWRRVVRDVLTTSMADGAYLAGFDRSGWYVLRRGTTEDLG